MIKLCFCSRLGVKKPVAVILLVVCHLCFAGLTACATVKSYKQSQSGVTFRLDAGLMKINICRDDIVEVKYTMFDSFPSKTSLVINNPLQQKAAFTVAEDGDNIVIITKKLKITVSKATNAIAFADLNGATILSERLRFDNFQKVVKSSLCGVSELRSPAKGRM